MSKITNEGLTLSGTECCTHMATMDVKGLKHAAGKRQNMLGGVVQLAPLIILDLSVCCPSVYL